MKSLEQRPLRREMGFTLIELLVVLAIIGLMVGVLLPALRYARNIARDTVCLSNHRQIAAAWNLYFNDFDNFPVRDGQTAHLGYGWGGVHFYGRDQNGDPNWNVVYLPPDRPLNSYMCAREVHEAENLSFRCPRDQPMHYAGTGEPVHPWMVYGEESLSEDGITTIYGIKGTSYAANWMMYREIGAPGLVWTFGDPAPEYRDHYGPSDVRVAPSLFPLVIDGGAWHGGWWPEENRRLANRPVGWWHGFNIGYMAFLDGSARGEEMGAPLTPGYSMFLDPARHDY